MDTPDETTSLISAGKVQGTDVYNTGGEKLGDIYDVMLDKRSGRIAYAIMSFGGILGIGKQYHPLPWQTLKYDTRQGGYVVGLTKEALEGGPAFGTDRDQPGAIAPTSKASTITTRRSHIGPLRYNFRLAASGRRRSSPSRTKLVLCPTSRSSFTSHTPSAKKKPCAG